MTSFRCVVVILCACAAVATAAPKKSCKVSTMTRRRCGPTNIGQSECQTRGCCYDTKAFGSMKCFRKEYTLSFGHQPTKSPTTGRNPQPTNNDKTFGLLGLLGNSQIDQNLAIASLIADGDSNNSGVGKLALGSVLGSKFFKNDAKFAFLDKLRRDGLGRKYIGGSTSKPINVYGKRCDVTKVSNTCGTSSKDTCGRWGCCWHDVTKTCYHATVHKVNKW
uniref:Uncharacterized LOC100184022 n=1 Tax=Ciona intestinalis TaxID=7719 RepID=F6U6Q9_CIOIN|nr:uncharacterized protein LOC100184022 [Ciona intestinalis]|eukprot:XP_002127880.1 uncharacterized protein LOC100184022 [Ciona intestinalis]